MDIPWSGYPILTDQILNSPNARVYQKVTILISLKIHQPKKGDIIISRVGTIGEVSIVVTEEPFCLGQNTAFIIPQKCHEYIFFALKSILIKEQINDAVVGSTLQHLVYRISRI
jgi:restriction endonuclease S subunit